MSALFNTTALQNSDSNAVVTTWLYRLSLPTQNAVTSPIQNTRIQTGYNASGTGNAGSVVITIPSAYASTTSYNVFVTHENTSPLNTSVVRLSATQFQIYWTNGGPGTQPFMWMAVGS